MTTTAPDIAVVQALIDRHFDIWNDHNPENWPAKFTVVYASQFYVADDAGVANGYGEVAQLIQRVQADHPDYTFRPDPVAWNHGLGRVTWGYGPKAQPYARWA